MTSQMPFSGLLACTQSSADVQHYIHQKPMQVTGGRDMRLHLQKGLRQQGTALMAPQRM